MAASVRTLYIRVFENLQQATLLYQCAKVEKKKQPAFPMFLCLSRVALIQKVSCTSSDWDTKPRDYAMLSG